MEQVSVRMSSACLQMRVRGEHRLEQLTVRLYHAGERQLTSEARRLLAYSERMERAALARVERERFRLQLLRQRVEAADPDLLLKRGYSMTLCGGKLVRRASELKKGDEITTRLAEGEVRSVIQ